jgi:hypothetical protein
MRAVFCLTEHLLASEEGLCFMGLVLLAELRHEYRFNLVIYVVGIAVLETKQNF